MSPQEKAQASDHVRDLMDRIDSGERVTLDAATVAQIRAEEKRERRAARGPGFSVVRPPVPTKRTGPKFRLPDVSTDPAVGLALASALLSRRKHRSTSPLPAKIQSPNGGGL